MSSMADDDFKTDLPIFDWREQIVSTVDGNQVTIITAETGAGKSTQVPQYLASHGYGRVIVTQPRILAARNLCRRVREEWAIRTGKDSDSLIGYRTAHERDDSMETSVLYCTDGLQLVRELTGSGTSERQVLVLDEVHEWNENMEVLVAWAKKRCQEEPHFKVVIMSATIETGSLAEYFGTSAVINVPGRSYEVTKRRGSDVISEIFNQLDNHSSNMLVFLPGKAEIENVGIMVGKKAASKGVPVIPLHSQLEATAQQQAFASYPNGKIILATNIAQTSVTIDDIDVVIDSGLERRSEVRSGVEGLFISQVSQADCLQRAGRAGRTKAGTYILAPLDDMPCLNFDDRPDYATPEIMRKHIDRLTLRLANVGIDIELLDFYHDPTTKAIKTAKRTLMSLGALTPSGAVTRIGREMEQFPVESSYARMLVEVQQYNRSVQAKLAAIISIQEVGGIVKGGTRYSGWKRFTRQTKSDLLAQYDVFLALPNVDPEDYEDLGIIGKNIAKAREVIERLDHDLGLEGEELVSIDDSEEPKILQSIVAGQLHQLWTIEPSGEAVHLTTKRRREISSSSVVAHPKLVVGTPFDLQVPTQRGDLETLHLVNDITTVDVSWLVALATNVFFARQGKVYFDPRQGKLAVRQLVRFGGRVIEGGSTAIVESTPSYRKMFNDAYATWLYDKLEAERRATQHEYKRRIPKISLQQLKHQTMIILNGAISLDEISPRKREELEKLGKLSTHLNDGFMAKLGNVRQSHHGEESRRRFWQPPHKRKYDRTRGR